MRLTTNPQNKKIIDAILADVEPDQPLYLVGGCIRDLLLGREFNDLDFVMPDDPTPFAKAVAKRLKAGFFVLDDERRTTRIVLKNEMGEMFPLDFVKFTGDCLEEDLRSRDFTINAMAISIHDLATVIDPLDGQLDLEKGCLRLCHSRALLDDPVRVLRGIRMALQFGFDFEPGLEYKFKEAAAYLPNTSHERQRDEFFKILDGNNPAKGLEFCRKSHVFNAMIPSLVEQEAVPAPAPHILPLIDHTMAVVTYLDQILTVVEDFQTQEMDRPWWLVEVIDALAPFAPQLNEFFQEEITPGRTKRSLALLGALLHDLGKPMTMKLGEDGRLHYHNHAQVGADLAEDVTKGLKLSNAECHWVTQLVRHHMDLLPFTNGKKALTPQGIYRFFQKVDEVGVAIILHILADTLGTYGEALPAKKWDQSVHVAQEFLSAWWNHKESIISPTPLLDGHDIQRIFGLKPGVEIGRLLDFLLEAQVRGEVRTQGEAETFISKQIK